jgi:arylsulfatase A-like enzyme
VDQRTLTRRYTDKAIGFVEKNRTRPFFIYLPHAMPHIPLYVPDDVRDPNPKHAYINTIEHLDTEVGRLFEKLRELKLAESTYVIFTSDNGPWLTFKHHGGSAGPLRGGKTSVFEGGHRVPCIVWAPGRVPAGTECGALASTLDVLPTMAALTQTPLPAGLEIDGLDISRLLTGEAKTVREDFLYYTMRGRLEGIREGDWKLLVRQPDSKQPTEAAAKPEVLLFNLTDDLGEKTNLAASRPELVERLKTKMRDQDAAITASARPAWKAAVK